MKKTVFILLSFNSNGEIKTHPSSGTGRHSKSLTYGGRDKIVAIFADDIYKCISLNDNFWISNKISFKYVPQCLIDNKPSLVQNMDCRRAGDKPLSEPVME